MEKEEIIDEVPCECGLVSKLTISDLFNSLGKFIFSSWKEGAENSCECLAEFAFSIISPMYLFLLGMAAKKS